MTMRTTSQNLSATYNQRGFVLVTSLIFLVVITLLAVSAINSSTIQERMASNLREKSRARQAADAALRQGELLLRDPAFNSQRVPGETINNVSNPDQETNSIDVKIWRRGEMLAKDADPEDSTAFLDDAVWQSKKNAVEPLSYDVDAQGAGIDAVRYYVEDYDVIGRDLNPDSAARADGVLMYRVTARAQGQNPAAVAVTQSLYEKRY